MIYAVIKSNRKIISSDYFKNKEKAKKWFDMMLSRKPAGSGLYYLAVYDDMSTKPFYEEVRY